MARKHLLQAKAEPSPSSVAVPPVINDKNWADFSVFRETFLYYLTHPPDNQALRVFGNRLFFMVLECNVRWPDHPESGIKTLLRAVLADLRYLQGFLEPLESDSAMGEDAKLYRLATEMRKEIRQLADRAHRRLRRV